MRFASVSLPAALALAACTAPTPSPTSRAVISTSKESPDTPPGVKIDDPRYRDLKPDTDPMEPRRTPASRVGADKLVAPIMTE